MRLTYFVFLLIISACATFGQGTFTYDQQSADETHILEGSADIQPNQPIGQSFVPTLSSVGFIRLYVADITITNTSPGSLLVNLRAGSITGPILASTDSVLLPVKFAGVTDFVFSQPATVAPGTTYYFQPVVGNGNNWAVSQADYGYPGGTAFFLGSPSSQAHDLWFREGIIIPEPASGLLIVIAIVSLVWRRARLRSHPSTRL